MITGKQIFNGSGGIDCLLNIGRFLGTKDMKKIQGDPSISKLLPSLNGKGFKKLLEGCEIDLIDLLTKILKINSK